SARWPTSRAARSRPWSRPTSPPAGSTSTTSPTSSTTTRPTRTRGTCTGPGGRVVPAAAARRSRLSCPSSRPRRAALPGASVTASSSSRPECDRRPRSSSTRSGADADRSGNPGLSCFGQAVELVLQLLEGLRLQLADALSGDPELAPDLLQGRGLCVETEAQLEDPRFALGQVRYSPPYRQPPQRLGSLCGRVQRLRVGEQVTELAVVLRPDRPVERDRSLRHVERLVDVPQREARLGGQLLTRRLPPEPGLEPGRGAAELHPALVPVRRDPDRVRLPLPRAPAGP